MAYSDEMTTAARVAELVGPLEAGRPRYAALAARLRLLIADGRLPAGTRLPSERDLTAALGCSRTTVTRAYAELRDTGYLTSRVGSGSVAVLPHGERTTTGRALTPAELSPGDIDLTCAATRATPGMLEAYEHALAALPSHLVSAGYPGPGVPELREALAQRYAARGLPTSADQIVLASGAVTATGLAVGTLGRAPRVLVESPGYPNTIDLLRRHRARLQPLPVEPTGLHVASAAETVRRAKADAAVLLPDFHNPTGGLLDDAGRETLAAALGTTWAVVDETVADIDLEPELGPMPRPFAAYAPRTITVGSASKTWWGGLRVGWLRAPRRMAETLTAAAASASLGVPVLEQMTLLHLLRTRPYLDDDRRRDLRESRDVTVSELARLLPEARVVVPRGGLCLWVELPLSSTALVLAARRYGVHAASGPRFAVGAGLERWLRIPYVHPAPVQADAVRRLALAYADVVAGEPQRGRDDLPIPA